MNTVNHLLLSWSIKTEASLMSLISTDLIIVHRKQNEVTNEQSCDAVYLLCLLIYDILLNRSFARCKEL